MSDRFEAPGRLGKAGLIGFVVASFVALMAMASSASATSIVPDSGPLAQIITNPGLDCQLLRGDTPEFDTGDTEEVPENYCATTVYTDASDLSYGAPDYTDRFFFQVSQDSTAQGSGTQANPYTITTVVQALPDREVTSAPALAAEPQSDSLLTITQVDSYVNGDDFYRTDVTVHNDLNQSQNVSLYHSADCRLENDDLGLADQDSNSGPVFCTPDVSTETDLRTAATSIDDPAIEGFIPVGTDSHFKEAAAGEGDGPLFDEPQTGAQYGDTCPDCGATPGDDPAVDNGVGLSWGFNLPGGGSERRCFYTVDSWDGNEPDVPSSCTPAAKPPTIAQKPPPVCKLRISRARVFLFSRHPRLRLVARYRTAAPADVQINFKAIENGNKVDLGDVVRHFNRHGLFRLRQEITQNQSDTLWQTHKFVVHFKIPGEPGFCQRKYRKELTVPRIVDGQRVVFQSDSKFGPGSPGHPEHG
jgi:hypothetical protein